MPDAIQGRLRALAASVRTAARAWWSGDGRFVGAAETADPASTTKGMTRPDVAARPARRRARPEAIAASCGLLLCLPGQAQAQNVFVCRTLYDDLASFDRRAWQAMVGISDRPKGEKEEEQLPNHRSLPAIIRTDPTRLRLIAELRLRGCERIPHYSLFADEGEMPQTARRRAEPVLHAKD